MVPASSMRDRARNIVVGTSKKVVLVDILIVSTTNVAGMRSLFDGADDQW
jgi:hypothetical protein